MAFRYHSKHFQFRERQDFGMRIVGWEHLKRYDHVILGLQPRTLSDKLLEDVESERLWQYLVNPGGPETGS